MYIAFFLILYSYLCVYMCTHVNKLHNRDNHTLVATDDKMDEARFVNRLLKDEMDANGCKRQSYLRCD